MPSRVYFLFILLSNVVQPVFFMKKLFATRAAFYNVPLVVVPRVPDELVIAPKLFMAIFAFVSFMTQEAHGIVKAGRWL